MIPFLRFSRKAVRRIVYTTNAIEALNAKLRRAVRTRGHFPTDDAATKLLFLVLRRLLESGKCRRASGSRQRPNSLIMFDERLRSSVMGNRLRTQRIPDSHR